MLRKIFLIMGFAIFLLVLSLGSISLAQTQGGNLGGTQSPSVSLINPLCPNNDPNCANSDVNGLLNSIVDWLLIIATPIAVGMILFGAFQMLFSGGNEETFKKGKTTILYTAIGYAIILVGKGLTSVIQDLLSH